MPEVTSFELDHDEAAHLSQLPEALQVRLHLANTAAVAALNILTVSEDYAALNEPKGLSALLLAKCAHDMRFAVNGLSLGYYSGASAVLRSAFEALANAALLMDEPDQLAAWIRNQLSNRPPGELERDRQALNHKARAALLRFERDRRVVNDATRDFVEAANRHIHASLRGLAQQFGLEAEWLIPSDFDEALIRASDDFEKALGFYVLMSQQPQPLRRNHKHENGQPAETFAVTLINRYDEGVLDSLASFAFYIAHRLLDLTKESFAVGNKEWDQIVKQWHQEMRQAPDLDA